MRRLTKAIDDPRDEVRSRSTGLSVTRYLDPAELAQERETIFRKRPLVIAHASELEAPGDFVTARMGEVPILVTRAQDGVVRAFVNACRHRGARLVDAERGCKKLLTCPYHAWTYKTDGSLFRIPHEEAFDTLDHDSLALAPLATEVRHGFVWVQLEGEIDVSEFLGSTLDDDFEAFGLADHRMLAQTTRTTPANWKLVMDAFAEGYHLESLHSESLARFFLPLAVLDDCHPHIRQMGARKSLLEVKSDESRWDVRRHTTVFYDLFPNTVLVFHPHWLSALTMVPLAVDGVSVTHRMLAPDIEYDDGTKEKLDKSFRHIDEQVFEKEDLHIAASIQSTLASGANTRVLLGGLEEGMRLFHAARDRALAEG